jgi:hypothetical protein
MDLLINIKTAKSLGHYPSHVTCPASHRASTA